MPDERVLEQLCALSGDDVAVFAAQIQAERARTDEGKSMWLMIAKRLAGGASTAILTVVFTITLLAGYAGDARASGLQSLKTQWVSSLYIVSSAKSAGRVFLESQSRRWPAFFALIACFFLFQSLLQKR